MPAYVLLTSDKTSQSSTPATPAGHTGSSVTAAQACCQQEGSCHRMQSRFLVLSSSTLLLRTGRCGASSMSGISFPVSAGSHVLRTAALQSSGCGEPSKAYSCLLRSPRTPKPRRKRCAGEPRQNASSSSSKLPKVSLSQL